MKRIECKVIDGEKVVTWFNHKGTEQCARIGDHVNVTFHDDIFNIINGRVENVFDDCVAVHNDDDFVVMCFFDTIKNMELVKADT